MKPFDLTHSRKHDLVRSDLFTACSLLVHCLFTAYSLLIHCADTQASFAFELKLQACPLETNPPVGQ